MVIVIVLLIAFVLSAGAIIALLAYLNTQSQNKLMMFHDASKDFAQMQLDSRKVELETKRVELEKIRTANHLSSAPMPKFGHAGLAHEDV